MTDIEQKWVEFRNGTGETAFRSLFDSCYEPLCRYSYAFLRDKESAEETVLDFLLHLWIHAGEIKIERSFVAYARRSIHNRCLNRLRRKNRMVSLDDVVHPYVDTDRQMDSDELLDVIWAAAAGLPEDYRETFDRAFKKDETNAEIAKGMGVSVKSVERYKTGLYKSLRKAVKKVFILLIITFV